MARTTPYADYFVMDKNPPNYPYSLWDFFNFNQTPLSPPNISVPSYPNGYLPQCFHNPKGTNCFGSDYPSDPDSDGSESD